MLKKCVLGVRVSFDPFWYVFFTYLVLRVTENIEMSYRTLTVRITGGQSVNLNHGWAHRIKGKS